MNLLTKIIRADEGRKTRFHDHQGQLVSIWEIALLPLRLIEFIRVKVGSRLALPWWPSGARRRIEALIQKEWTIVEFGSGMSTAWLAARARRVLAVEDNRESYDTVCSRLKGKKIANAEVLYRTKSEYFRLDIGGSVDLVVVDGQRRRECIEWAMGVLRPNGFIYLDNSDRDLSGNSEGARSKLLRLCHEGSLGIEFFRGFPPGLLAPTEGALARRTGAITLQDGQLR